MFAMAAAVVTIVAIASGSVVGVVFGFSLASHRDVMNGFRPVGAPRLVRFLARPTREYNLREGLMFIGLMLVWLVTFFVLCAVPVLAASKLDGDGSPLIAYSVLMFLVASYVGRHIGRKLWLRYA